MQCPAGVAYTPASGSEACAPCGACGVLPVLAACSPASEVVCAAVCGGGVAAAGGTCDPGCAQKAGYVCDACGGTVVAGARESAGAPEARSGLRATATRRRGGSQRDLLRLGQRATPERQCRRLTVDGAHRLHRY